MARQVLPIVGAVVGAYFGNPQLGYAIGAIIGNAVDPQVINGPKLGDASIQTAAEGVFRPVVHGTAAVKGNIIHRGNRRVIIVKEQQGKGGPVTKTERELWTFAVRIAEGPIAGVTRFWVDEKLAYDNRPNGDIPEESLEYGKKFRLYLGGEDQLPDPKLEAWLGIGNVNAYRGTAYIVFADFDLTDSGGRVPDFRFEVSTSAEGIALPRLPPLSFPPSYGHGGGMSVGSLSDMYASIGSISVPQNPDIQDGLLLWHPLMQVTFTRESSLAGGLVRGRVIGAEDEVVFDSGWLGDPSRKSALDELLIANGRTDLVEIGPISSAGSVAAEVRLPVGNKTKGVRIYRARPAGAANSTGGRIVIQYPNRSGYPEGTLATATQGVMVQPDGALIATSWGPDNIYQAGAMTSLSAIVSWLHLRAGHSPADYNVAQLSDMVNGIVLAGDYSCADAIRTLQPIYMFDYSEHDAGAGYRCNYVKRGGPVLRTLTIDDLVDMPEEATREDALERPRVLHMHFESPTVGYAPAKASPRRNSPDARVVGEQSIQVPVSFRSVDEAWRRADVMLKVLWTEVSGEREFVLSDRDLDLVPTDCIGLALRGRLERLRLTEVMLDNGMLRCKATNDRQSAYTSTLTGVPLPPPTPPVPSIAGQTVWEFLDLPALNDSLDSLHYYMAATSASAGWVGAEVQRLEGAEYEGVRQFTSAAVMGVLLDPVSAASPHYTDTTNRVRLTLAKETVLPNLTEHQFLSEGGAFALEHADGSFEVLQYRDSEEVSDGEWELSTLLRGRMGSASGAHPAGARFVLLSGVRSVPATTAMIGTSLTHRVVSYRNSPETAVAQTDYYAANSQIELPVASLFLSRVSDSIQVRAVPRHRFGTEDHPVRSVHWLGYDWIATDGVNSLAGSEINDSWSFDAMGWDSPITVEVSQRNRFTGRGPPVLESIE